MSEKGYNLICSYLHVHRGAHFQHQVDDNHRYYDNAFTWVMIMTAFNSDRKLSQYRLIAKHMRYSCKTVQTKSEFDDKTQQGILLNRYLKICSEFCEIYPIPRLSYDSRQMSVLDNCGKGLRRDHTLSSDLPLMRFFFISPQQKISSLHTGNETDSEFEVFSKRMTF